MCVNKKNNSVSFQNGYKQGITEAWEAAIKAISGYEKTVRNYDSITD